MSGRRKTARLSGQELAQLAGFRQMAEAHLERLGAVVERRRKKLGLSRRELGERIHVVDQTIKRWERATTGTLPENLSQVAEGLETDAETLLAEARPGSTEPSREPGDFGDRPVTEPASKEDVAQVHELVAQVLRNQQELVAAVREFQRAQEAKRRSRPSSDQAEPQTGN